MSTPAFPHRSAETLAVRRELVSSPKHTHALQALAALSETEEADPVAVADDLPPLPEDLRSRWQEAYGERATAPQPVRRAARTGGFAEWLASLLQPRQLVWGGTFAAVVLLGTVAMLHDWGGRETVGPAVTTRGTNHPTARAGSRPLVVIAPAGGGAALMQKLAEAYPERKIEQLASAAQLKGAGESLVIDVATRTLSVQNGGRTLREFALEVDSVTNPELVIPKIEDADEFLNQPGSSGR